MKVWLQCVAGRVTEREPLWVSPLKAERVYESLGKVLGHVWVVVLVG